MINLSIKEPSQFQTMKMKNNTSLVSISRKSLDNLFLSIHQLIFNDLNQPRKNSRMFKAVSEQKENFYPPNHFLLGLPWTWENSYLSPRILASINPKASNSRKNRKERLISFSIYVLLIRTKMPKCSNQMDLLKGC